MTSWSWDLARIIYAILPVKWCYDPDFTFMKQAVGSFSCIAVVSIRLNSRRSFWRWERANWLWKYSRPGVTGIDVSLIEARLIRSLNVQVKVKDKWLGKRAAWFWSCWETPWSKVFHTLEEMKLWDFVQDLHVLLWCMWHCYGVWKGALSMLRSNSRDLCDANLLCWGERLLGQMKLYFSHTLLIMSHQATCLPLSILINTSIGYPWCNLDSSRTKRMNICLLGTSC